VPSAICYLIGSLSNCTITQEQAAQAARLSAEQQAEVLAEAKKELGLVSFSAPLARNKR
jgi:hypothetical protein